MCKFLSWIEKPNGELKYISNFELNTRDGKKLKEKLNDDAVFYDDIQGHGAIREYFGLRCNDGINKEYTDFSSPDNFPKEIAQKIKNGEFSEIGINRHLLTELAGIEYEKIRQSAWKEYEKIIQPARDEYERIARPAMDKYERIGQLAWDEYERIARPAMDKYERIGQLAWDEYEKTTQSALDEYKRIEQSALDEYKKTTRSAWNEYERIEQLARNEYERIELKSFWELFKDPQNRNEAWE
jgi:cell division septum initiation protein DivIVA